MAKPKKTRRAGPPANPPQKRVAASELVSLADLVDDEDDEADDDREAPTTAFGYYLRDVDSAEPLLTKREELGLGELIAHRAVTLAIQLMERAKCILGLVKRRRAPAAFGPIAEAFLAEFNPKRLEGKRLENHLFRLYFLRGEDCPPQQTMYRLVMYDDVIKPDIDRFVGANVRLVITIAKRYGTGGLTFPELVQEGNLGLIHAIPRYDYRRGLRFSTFAGWWIRHSISRAISDKSRAVRLPVHMIDASYKIEKNRAALTAKLGRVPTTQELAKRVRMDVDKLEKMRVWTLPATTLDKPVGEDQDDSLLSYITYEDPEERFLATLIPMKGSAFLREALDEVLTPMEKDVIFQRFGLDDDEERTFREIGDRYSLSRERIRQIQERGLEKLRHRLRRQFAAAI